MSIPFSPARRLLMRGRAGVAVPAVRPPGAIAEVAFTAQCTRCDACIRTCPERIIRRGDGGFPELHFSATGCTFCGQCADVCEPRAIERRPGERALAAIATIGPGCVARQGVVCRSCADACEPSALVFAAAPGGMELPEVVAARCNGCGMCVAPCPVHATGVAGSVPR